ncbi:RNA polymerase sigma factor SigE [Streptantibioticus rubrisoli]|uniref:RNA polymerase sigma factor SigE n=1 Tax=Streptantibioticus rubrisoli TaxID=1387313 RepID=A0ABT1PF25_9ACTN|nr:RNA polymerase sigma factor SigE [Streptantibioticus rubrisoli]MCQ4043977.1 RNA polymerase sigma factor SigE [Streptantibioticus rubrisoli]
MVGALLDTTRADRGGAAVDGDQGVLRRFRRSAGQPRSVNETADRATAATAGSEAGSANATAAFAPTVSFGADGETWTPPSWEEIVSTHSARVYRLAYRLTGNQHDAEDLTQEVFVRVFRSLSTYTPGTFEGWLHRITTNLFLDMVRRRQRIRFDALGEDAAERLPSREPSPAQHFNDTHFDADIQQALDTLAPEFRAAVVLCDIEGLSYEEIAATLGVKLGTVRSRIHRGRSHLRSALQHRAPAARPGRAMAAVAAGGQSSEGTATRGRA